jgi:histidinol-phosphate aminotransferase
VVDLAYAEFADEDLTTAALDLPNALVVRTFSKAWGLAGLRLGCAIGDPDTIRWLRIAGQNYPVSALTLAVAEMRLTRDPSDVLQYVERVRVERDRLYALLNEWGATACRSQANFVLAYLEDAASVQLSLARSGISIRAFPDRPGLQNALRITCPGDREAFERLCGALREVISGTNKEES